MRTTGLLVIGLRRFCTRGGVLARLAASLAPAALVPGLAGCEKVRAFVFDAPSDTPPPPVPAPSSRPPVPEARRAADAGAPRVPLDPKLRRALKLAPRRAPTALVACGKGRIAVTTDKGVLVRSTKAFAETQTLPLDRPRGVLGLADGSLLFIGGAATLRLLPQDTKPKALPKVPLLPDSSLVADRVKVDRFWSLPRVGGTLFGFDAMEGEGEGTSAILGTAAWVELDAFDRRALGSLRDGSFLYTSGTAFRQFYGAGKQQPILGDSRDVWRILPGARPDTAWVFTGKKAALYMVLEGKLQKQRSLELETTPFDAESAAGTLAVLELAQPDDAPWSFVLEVFDAGTGNRRFRVPLDAVETFDDDWAKRLTENRALAVCAEPRAVAVGGATHLDVFGAERGEKLFSGQ